MKTLCILYCSWRAYRFTTIFELNKYAVKKLGGSYKKERKRKTITAFSIFWSRRLLQNRWIKLIFFSNRFLVFIVYYIFNPTYSFGSKKIGRKNNRLLLVMRKIKCYKVTNHENIPEILSYLSAWLAEGNWKVFTLSSLMSLMQS